eukprot:scaffold191_cov111-Isochrysis_galbana.AAC.1
MAPLQLRLEPTEMVLAIWTKMLRVSASSAPDRAHYRYDFAPARRPVARPEPAQRTAGARRRFVSSRSIHFVYNLRFDSHRRRQKHGFLNFDERDGKKDFTQSTPSRQSGMAQPVVQEMFATVHAAGSSLFSLRFIQFMYNLRCDKAWGWGGV